MRSSPPTESEIPAVSSSEEPPSHVPTPLPIILYVEDDDAVRDPVARYLRRSFSGFQIVTGESLAEGLELARKHQDNLVAVITDGFLSLDKKDTAVHLVQGIRNISPNIPFMVLSGDVRHFPPNAFPHQPLGIFEKGTMDGLLRLIRALMGVLCRDDTAMAS